MAAKKLTVKQESAKNIRELSELILGDFDKGLRLAAKECPREWMEEMKSENKGREDGSKKTNS